MTTPPDDLARAAAERPRGGFVGELFAFARQNRKWWLVPLIASLALLGAFLLLAGTAAAPFIYTLF